MPAENLATQCREGDWADELDRYSRHLAGAGWLGGFDGPGQLGGGGAAVLDGRVPRSGGELGRRDYVTFVEVDGFHSCDVASSAPPVAITWQVMA